MTTPEEMAERIAREVEKKGGRTYYVGGFVRDRVLGIENKDVDIEVHGVTAGVLEQILDGLGERTQMGASFGVYGLKHLDLDIALPRKEEATGRGHRDFAVFTDPWLGTEKAARRRDFTMNALMEDVLTGEIIDHFGGREDAKKGILRHVDSRSFPEDPLRVLRCAQFAARFRFSVAPETIALCKQMDLRALPRERVMGELDKALGKAPRPSVFFEVLRRMDQLDCWFPEVKTLIGVPQDPDHHPEGDVWNHTMAVLDAAAGMQAAAKEPRNLLLAALCHDFGKPETTCADGQGHIRALRHETAGVPLAKDFIKRLTSETEVRRYVANMVALHMRPNVIAQGHPKLKTTNRLFDDSLCPEDLLLLCKADRMGQRKEAGYGPVEALLRSRLEAYRETMAKPGVTGKDLVELGFRPGPAFSEALGFAHKLQLAGVEKEEALSQTKGFLKNHPLLGEGGRPKA